MKLNIPSHWTQVIINDFGVMVNHISGGRVQYTVSDLLPSARSKGSYIGGPSDTIAVGTSKLWMKSSSNAVVDVTEVSTAVMGEKFTYHSDTITTSASVFEYPLINFDTMRINVNAQLQHLGSPSQIQVYLTGTVVINGVPVVMPPPIGTEFVVEIFTEDAGQHVGFVGVYDHSRDTIQFFQATEQPLRTIYTFKVMRDDDSVWGGGIALTGITKIQ